ncbi:hypothetical protein KR009_012357, partial [Drosophila setifemur]
KDMSHISVAEDSSDDATSGSCDDVICNACKLKSASETCDSDDELSNVPTPSGVTDLETASSLEHCLNLIVRCVMCKSIPFIPVYQCHRGHPICAGCYQIRMNDLLLGSHLGTCPTCGSRIYRFEPHRNMVAERTLAELPVACEHCGSKMLRSGLRLHFLGECPKRLLSCKYRRLGCPWVGVAPELEAHQADCPVKNKSGMELLEVLRLKQAIRDGKQRLMNQILVMMQLPHIKLRLLHVQPQKDRESMFPRDCFVSVANFEVFHHRWSVLLKWQSPLKDGDPCAGAVEPGCQLFSSFVFQLRLDSANEVRESIVVSFTFVSGTYSEVRFLPNLTERFKFSPKNMFGPPTVFYRNALNQCNKLLNERGIYTRLLIVRN